MGRVLYGWAMVLVSPAKISCFNGLLHPTFCPFPSRVTFVNCNLTLSVGYRSNPIVAEYVCLDPVAEFVVIETQRFKEQVSEKLAKDRETIVEADDEGKTLAASEMLCNDGLQAFGLAAVAFAAGVLMRCLSCLTTCNVYFTEIIVICCDSKGNKSGYLLAIFSLISGSRLLRLPLRLRQLLLGFCILFSSQHLYNLCKFQQNVKRAELKQKEMKELQKDQRGTIP